MIFRFSQDQTHQPTYQGNVLQHLLDNVQTKLATKHLHHLVSPFTKKTVVYKDTNQLIADGFLRGEPQQRKSQHHLKDQEGHVCLRRFHGFLICMSMKLSMVQSPLAHRCSRQVTQDVITVNRVTNLRVNWIP